jgi:hypothetical protein
MMTCPQLLSVPITERNATAQRIQRGGQYPVQQVDKRDMRMDKPDLGGMGESASTQNIRYGSTHDGDVRIVTVEPSFDAEENAKRREVQYTDGSRCGPIFDSSDQSPMPQKRGKHTRDLSSHFFDATRLTDGLEGEGSEQAYPLQHSRQMAELPKSPPRSDIHAMYMNPSEAPPISPAVQIGQKHRRGYSEDLANPVAHRRINSIGNSAPVDRNYGYFGDHGNLQPPHPRSSYGHRREDSGLDILSAAANVSKEELAMAAGRPPPTVTWDHPPDPRRESQRMSPSVVTSASYEYPHGPPPGRPYDSGYPPATGPYQPAPYQAFYPPGGPPPPMYHQHAPPSYPIQYAPPPQQPSRGSDHYAKPSYLSQHGKHTKTHRGRESRRSYDNGIVTDERLFERPHAPAWSVPQGVAAPQSAPMSSIGAVDSNRGMRPSSRRTTTANPDHDNGSKPPASFDEGHHRKLSSFGNLMSSALFPDHSEASFAPNTDRDGGPHHRATSSVGSFLHALDAAGDLFLQNLGPPSGTGYQATFSPPSTKPVTTARAMETKSGVSVVSTSQGSGKSLAEGGTSKRVRRKCTIDNCVNRVVQGGLCIAHGAKRKMCKHPGCEKNVKKAGLCSSHGPARRRCDVGTCGKVAVQGGRCIAHGAKKRICAIEGCKKQAILTGMCKKHHDISNGIVGAPDGRGQGGEDDDEHSDGEDADEMETRTCIEIEKQVPTSAPERAAKPSHHRGLSIFQEISAESVQTLLSHDEETDGMHPLM